MSRVERLYQPPEIGAPGIRQGRRRRWDLVLAGAFVLAMAGVVGVLVFLNLPALFGGYELRAYFPNAAGLNRGMDVVQEGFSIGHVGAVEPVFNDAEDRRNCPERDAPASTELPCFRAELRIQRGWPVPTDSHARLAPAGFLGGNLIRIEPGLAGAILAERDVIPTLPRQPDLPQQAALALTGLQAAVDDTVRPALEELQERIQGLIGALGSGEDGEGGAGAAVGDGLAEVFQNLKQISSDVEQSLNPERIDGILAAVQELTSNLADTSAGFQDRSADVGAAVKQYTALGAELQELVSTAQPAVTGSLDDVQFLLQELSASLTPILTSIETASRNLSALSGDLRDDPKSLLFRSPQKGPSPWFESQ
jgi:phospholipid/cholesterol/gamma-HCH transport system substrate-binding protein